MSDTNNPKLILTIDDEPMIRQSFRAYLEDFDHDVIEAEDGESGMNAFRKHSPDLVLLDLNMPGMDGLEVLELLRDTAPDTPVIVISGTGRVTDIAQALRFGAWDYLFKPITDLTVLEHSINRSLERARLIQENKLYQQDLEQQVEQRTEQLQKSEIKYRNIFENLQDIYFETTPEGELIEISPSVAFESDYFREDLIGQKIQNIYLDQNERDPFLEILFAQGELRDYEITFKDKDGTPIPCALAARLFVTQQVIRKGSVGLSAIFLHVKKAEHALIESEERYRSLVSNIPVGLYRYSLDNGGSYITVNQAMVTMLDYDNMEELLATHPNDLYLDAAEQEIFLNTLLNNGEILASEIQVKKKDGSTIWTSVTAHVNKNNLGIIQYIDTMIEDISQRKEDEERIRHLSYYDFLTELPNRTMFLYRLKQALASASRNNQFGSIVLLDLDRFKTINDSLGHQIGDILLQHVAKRISSLIRDEDTVARIGGDEYAIIFSELSPSLDDAGRIIQGIAEKIRLEIMKPFFIQGHELYVTASLGIAMFPLEPDNCEEILKNASTAVSRIKDHERNRCLFYLPDMQDAAIKRLTLEKELRTALTEDQFELFYQPQVDKDGNIKGAEALIRWAHPEKGIISPMDFIPVAEETGLILPIGNWVIKTACLHLSRIEKSNLLSSLDSLSINVSPFQFKHADFTDIVTTEIEKAQIPANKLSLEITEGVAIDNLEDTIDKMLILKEKGIHFSIDDFGTGYSSLSYLARLPVAQLKIDKSSIMGITESSKYSSIVSTIIIIAESFGFSVVAEGVETETELASLCQKNCQIFQGYHFSKPIPFGTFLEKLRKGHV